MGLYGTGGQALYKMLALKAVRPITHVKVYSRNPKNRRAFCERMGPIIETPMTPVDTPREVMRGVDIVVCATNSNVAVFDGKARIFSSQVSAASAEAQARGQEVSLLLEDARSRLQLLVENNRNEGQNAIQGAGLILEKLRSAATVASQLAAGAMSAVNLSAGISGSSSDSISRNQSLSVGYAVDGGEAAPPNISTF